MALTDFPILSMLRERMQWHQERQRERAKNVANSDTPNYYALDLAPSRFFALAAGRLGGARAHQRRSHRRG